MEKTRRAGHTIVEKTLYNGEHRADVKIETDEDVPAYKADQLYKIAAEAREKIKGLLEW